RKGIFMIDASKGFMKDGNKNRLRSRDIHKIVDVFTQGEEHPGYSRLVPLEEIADPKNDYNLNLPRYIDTREGEDIQDIDAHLNGGIPARDLDALDAYWQVCPSLKESLFLPLRPGYLQLSDHFPLSTLNFQLKEHPQFAAFLEGMDEHFTQWRDHTATELKSLQPGCNPKEIIHQHSEALLAHYENHPQLVSLPSPLIDPYAVYQHLMDYWAETMQDDCYLIAAEGWQAVTSRIVERNKKTGKEKDKGWTCELVPKPLIVARYFAAEQAAIEDQKAELESLQASLTELEEEHGGEDGAFAELEKINNANVTARLREIATSGRDGSPSRPPTDPDDEVAILKRWQKLTKASSALKKAIKSAEAALDQLAHDQYPKLSEDEIKTLVVEDKWLATLETAIHGEVDRISQALTQRVKELASRYETPLPQMTDRVTALEEKVNAHLERMGFAWN
ncbi:MAG: N-6 DNA methylase, partial [Verrucomicrobiota bacterium JB023]|nr:N-6 DNA methylase [Verrucomicrobiota bacterium JB023]